MKEPSERIVIDGIRNTGEIARLEEIYGYQFVLIAVLSSWQARWERIKSELYLGKGLTEFDFHQDDARDRGEETVWGQQVELYLHSVNPKVKIQSRVIALRLTTTPF